MDVNLRLALLASCAIGCGVAPSNEPGTPTARIGDSSILRVAAANLTGDHFQYREPGIRILRGLAPDVTLIQEMHYGTSTPDEIRALVDAAFGTEFAYCREPEVGGIPNGIVSRYPILECGEWSDPAGLDRDFAWARIDVPGPLDLYAISVHMAAGSSVTRVTQAEALAVQIAALPQDALIVLGGDFNAGRGAPVFVPLAGVVGIDAPNPVDLGGNARTNAARVRTLDWVLANPALQARATATRIGAAVFPDGFVADTRVHTPIEDLAPALPEDSGSFGMQHMAVIREFQLAEGGGEPEPQPEPEPEPDPIDAGVPAIDHPLYINEVLANEPGSDPRGEAIELVNRSNDAIDLSGFTISDATQVRHVFAPGVSIAAHRALIVRGSNASTGTLELNNHNGDTVTLEDAAGEVVDTMSYTSGGRDGVSLTRWPEEDPTAPFIAHDRIEPLFTPSSLGTRVRGGDF
jgi:endonuclease/exonuclease/phosphatase family metal-dependent hydrolase